MYGQLASSFPITLESSWLKKPHFEFIHPLFTSRPTTDKGLTTTLSYYLTSAWSIHCLLAGDLRNSKGDGEKGWYFTRGTPPVANMPETAWPQRARPNHPTPSPIDLGCWRQCGIAQIIRAQVGCLSQPHKGAAQIGPACPALLRMEGGGGGYVMHDILQWAQSTTLPQFINSNPTYLQPLSM